MEDLTRHYLISGRVQGVGFRAFAHRTAQMLKLRGWVRNLADGRVEALARGTANGLAEFESRLREGPPAGRVDAMLVKEIRPGEFSTFEVRKDGDQPCSES
jgi:acylphosphatase